MRTTPLFIFGTSRKEQAIRLEQISTEAARRASANPHDKLTVTLDGERFRISGGQPIAAPMRDLVQCGPPRPRPDVVLNSSREVERHLRQHYREVRERVMEACHY
jgi:hypothetical protein